MKQVHFKLETAAGDLNRKIKQIDGFLANGKEVAVKVKLHGRQLNDPARGYEHLDWIVSQLENATHKGKMSFSGGCVRIALR